MAFKAADSGAFGTGASIVLTVPASTLEGDRMVVMAFTVDNSPAITPVPPATETWTLEAAGSMPTQIDIGALSNPATWIYTKLASADDEANAGTKTYTWGLGTAEEKIGWLGLYDNFDAGQFAKTEPTGTATTALAPSVTTTVPNEIALHCAMKDTAAVFTALPSGASRLNITSGAGASGGCLAIVEETFVSPAATGTKSFTMATDERAAFTFSLEIVPPTLAGLEYTSRENRLHYDALFSRLHYLSQQNRLHYDVSDED